MINNGTEIIILLFILITFVQSAVDKISDWKGNLSWLKEHFANTVVVGVIPFSLGLVFTLELIVSLVTLKGLYDIFFKESLVMGYYSCVLAALTLLILLIGQRLAKDYDGARTIVIYLMPVIFGMFIMQG